MEQSVFEHVTDALSGLVSRELGQLRYRTRRFGIKIWFDDETPPREHYEAQVIGGDHMQAAVAMALEVGFHAEHPVEADNDAVLAYLLAAEAQWRPDFGFGQTTPTLWTHVSWQETAVGGHQGPRRRDRKRP